MTIINEPGRSPVIVRDSDSAKFGTKTEQSTNLWMYAQRRPAPYEQSTETKIKKQSNDLKRQKRGEINIHHRQRDTTSVVSSVNSIVSRSLTVPKPVKPQPKRRRQTILTEPSDTATTSPQQLISIVPAPPAPTTRDHQEPSMSSASRDQTEGVVKENGLNFTASQTKISPQQVLWRKTKKEKKTENSVVALIQDAKHSRVPSPPRPDIQIGQTSTLHPRIRYYEYEQERELSGWDAENKI